MSWEISAQIAQVIGTIILGSGVIVSIWIGLKGLKESEKIRIQSVRPELYFSLGAQKVQCQEVYRDGILGIDSKFAQEYLKNKPQGATRLDSTELWGRLRNHGNGSALNTQIVILPRAIHKGREVIEIKESDLHRFPFHVLLNTIPATPSHIPPQEEAMFLRFPT